MRYHNILHDNMANGDGLRVVLFVSGCDHHCKGCQNPVTWEPNDGLEFTVKEKSEVCEQLSKDYISENYLKRRRSAISGKSGGNNEAMQVPKKGISQ